MSRGGRREASTHLVVWEGARRILPALAAGVWLAVALAVSGLAARSAAAADAAPGFRVEQFADGQEFENACSDEVAPRSAQCLAWIRIAPGTRGTRPDPGRAAASPDTIGDNGAYDPSWLQSAYETPSQSDGGGETVAVVDAYDDPNAESDLAAYRANFGLPACTTANGCFSKVDQTGGSTPPAANTQWAEEISVDLDMVSAICPNCHILLVEANSNSIADLGTAVNEAVSLGAQVVNNSYGVAEYAGEQANAASYYNHEGVAITAAVGDNGYGVEFPAADPDVTAVGGTTLDQSSDDGSRDATETAWDGGGSGCSAYEPKPAWQDDSGCSQRTVVDVAADADPSTGVWVYDSYPSGTWQVFGGTSVASAIIAGVYGLAGAPAPDSLPASYPYADPGGLNDIVSGSNGSCGGSYLCTAGVGYDGPTGLGTPDGIAAFVAPADKMAQTITFAAPASGPVGGSTPLDPTASSGLTVSLVVDGSTTNGACSLSGDTVDYLAAGQCVLDANQDGDTQYLPAAEVQRTIDVSAASVPGAPTSVNAIAGDGEATVSFDPPGSNGGSPISSYTVTAQPGGATGTGAASPITVSSLANGTAYTFTVTATNGVGTGPASQPSSAVTPEASGGAAPVVSGVAPDQGPAAGSTAVTITGTGFSTAPGATVFDFGSGNPASAVACGSTTSCTASSPPGSGTVDVRATVAGQTSTTNPPGDAFTYVAAGGSGGGGGGGGTDSIAVSISPGAQTIATGGTASWTIVVTNIGGDYLFDISVTDALAPECDSAGVPGLGLVAPTVSVTYGCSLAGVGASFTNTVVATGTGAAADTVTAADTGAVTVTAPPAPSPAPSEPAQASGTAPKPAAARAAVAITVTPAAQSVGPGRSARLAITVRNLGGVTLSRVAVADRRAPGCARRLGSLEAGSSRVYACSRADVESAFDDVATVTAASAAGTVSASAQAHVGVDLVGSHHASIRIVVSPKLQTVTLTIAAARAAAGGKGATGTAAFVTEVANDGDVALDRVTVSDPLAAACDRSLGLLAPGAAHVYRCHLAGVGRGFVDLAVATGKPPTGASVSAEARARVVVGPPAST